MSVSFVSHNPNPFSPQSSWTTRSKGLDDNGGAALVACGVARDGRRAQKGRREWADEGVATLAWGWAAHVRLV